MRPTVARTAASLASIPLTLSLAACASRSTVAAKTHPPATGINAAPVEFPQRIENPEGVRSNNLFRAGPVYIAGQPDEQAFERFVRENGVTVVVNLRTQREMDNPEHVPFDQPALLDRLGVEYVHIPLGGDDNPYTPAAVDTFAEALARHEGAALLHCAVAWRASHMWAAYLARHRGFSVSEAHRHGAAMLVDDTPFEMLLGVQFVSEWE